MVHTHSREEKTAVINLRISRFTKKKSFVLFLVVMTVYWIGQCELSEIYLSDKNEASNYNASCT